MLDYLHIRGLALLDDVALELGRGMNVLTGETGAGKSIIVDALGLIRGGRGRAELVREGSELAEVEAQFALDAVVRARVAPLLSTLGFGDDEDQLVVGRSVRRAGRGRAQLQSRLVTRAALAQVGSQLVDICSQHEHHSLTDVGAHIDLLDHYAKLGDDRHAYAQNYRAWQTCCMQLRDVRAAASERLRRVDYLRFQVEELEAHEEDFPRVDELRERLALLRDAQRWSSFAAEAQHRLYEADDAICSQLASMADTAGRGADAVRALAEMSEQLEAAVIACDEAARAAASLATDLDADPAEFDTVAERVHEIDHLERKHACTAAELSGHLDAMRKELAELEGADEREAELEREEAERSSGCQAGAKRLRAARKRAARRLAAQIERELGALHMPDARVEVAVRPRPQGDLGPRGSDEVEFLFSANPGEPLAALNRVASGGELSRVLLAVKSVLATGDPVVTYVFDEVDAGVGGAVAEAIGRRLCTTARERQVLCITHLPQIAAFAEQHFHVEKRRLAGRTVTRVRRLSAEERVEELARMLAGAKVTDAARKHARDLIDAAQAWRSKGAGTKARPKSRKRSATAARSAAR